MNERFIYIRSFKVFYFRCRRRTSYLDGWVLFLGGFSLFFFGYLDFLFFCSVLFRKILFVYNYEFFFRCSRSDMILEVYSEDGVGIVKDGGEGGYERRYYYSYYEFTEFWG